MFTKSLYGQTKSSFLYQQNGIILYKEGEVSYGFW